MMRTTSSRTKSERSLVSELRGRPLRTIYLAKDFMKDPLPKPVMTKIVKKAIPTYLRLLLWWLTLFLRRLIRSLWNNRIRWTSRRDCILKRSRIVFCILPLTSIARDAMPSREIAPTIVVPSRRRMRLKRRILSPWIS